MLPSGARLFFPFLEIEGKPQVIYPFQLPRNTQRDQQGPLERPSRIPGPKDAHQESNSPGASNTRGEYGLSSQIRAWRPKKSFKVPNRGEWQVPNRGDWQVPNRGELAVPAASSSSAQLRSQHSYPASSPAIVPPLRKHIWRGTFVEKIATKPTIVGKACPQFVINLIKHGVTTEHPLPPITERDTVSPGLLGLFTVFSAAPSSFPIMCWTHSVLQNSWKNLLFCPPRHGFFNVNESPCLHFGVRVLLTNFPQTFYLLQLVFYALAN